MRMSVPVPKPAGIGIENRLMTTLCLWALVASTASLAIAQTAPPPPVTRIAAPLSSPAIPAVAAHPSERPAAELLPPTSQVVPVNGICSQPALCGPAPIHGVHCAGGRYCGELSWKAMGPIPFDVFAQGEYVGPARTRHVPEYRVRVDDSISFVFRLSQTPSATPYRLEVGDEVRIESLTAPELNRDVQIQPDGTITVGQLGQIPAANRTIEELRKALEEAYKRLIREPTITVSPIDTNTRLEELRATVDRRFGAGGQATATRVTPEGTVQLPGIGSVSAQGLTLSELKREVDARYAELVSGLDVTPILEARAPRYVYVLGEVARPGRYELEGPTTVMQALALAGSWKVGANLNQVVVFRRDANWCLMATKLDIRGALYGKRPCPADEIWIRDSDIVVVPKSPILVADEFIELVFTRGIYGVFPINNITDLSTL
ncbi:MAG: sugar ABC transporter substrate-binding protein [Planctomycetales bacterium]|nr:sugar ABC transporter substrate-binding protein [Planctomycetales bacterium]NIM09051.1 sugar ABC transporter substrate-binding protein [Planctomycetales bacterium]NIN08514.1 sugar ABC transporter substrate-binding protein [Planctomycetales bacterium]NIN77648.1 sugar ABC transporter substrate-binding protein [Planctomycetales bacterium]NIO34811.1 sugar ABC transporter substrate-binding protein [Planctomycetales bacterium]